MSLPSKTRRRLPRLYRYIDYRQYLSDLFDVLQREDPRFSYRNFAGLAGSTSPNFLQLIKSRKLNISSKAMEFLAQELGLTEREFDYFQTIVAFDHAKTADEKDAFFQKILRTRRYEPMKQLRKKQYDYFSHWYLPVIKELVVSSDYPGDPSWIGRRIVPAVSESRVVKGITLLESLGIIEKDHSGTKWVAVDSVVRTSSEVISLAITRYHKSVIALGRDAIERFSAGERDIRSATLGLTAEGYREVKKRMESFWEELLAFADTQEKTERVYQVNMQTFPVSKSRSKRKGKA
ncbi:MAG: TIGR02147 family protein [Chitinivibrionales bacterium]|nr:TIGR02147 family protein [Chitinivibrionales bacterium]